MSEMVDQRMKALYEANKIYDDMFRGVAREMNDLRSQVDHVDQNTRNTHLVLTGLAPEFQTLQGVVQFVQIQLKIKLQLNELVSVTSIGVSKQGQTLTR